MTEQNQTHREAGGEERKAASFAALGLRAEIADKLAEAEIVSPTPVQAGVIPPLLAGRDGILRSPTGSGKTLAYLLPVLQLIDPQRRETQAIVIAPTQELAMQIVRVAETYGGPLGIKTVALIGGAALSRQLDRMKQKPALVVGTPGRIREVVSLRKLPLHTVTRVVVDETDRVFALGGRSDVEAVLKGAARDRQTVFVSATRTDAMREAEARWLRDPWETTVEEEAGSGLPATIEHAYFVSDARDKIDLVRRLVRTLKPKSALVFVNDIERIGELVAKLRYEGFAVDALYADTPGRERGEVLRKFREGRTKLLIATDVAARGLDVPGLALVVQFEPALDADHYVHRAGRTGRMGRSGQAITIVTPQERFIMSKLAKQLGIELAERRLQHGRMVAPDAASGRERTTSPEGRGAKADRPARASGPAGDSAAAGKRA
ncbi:DEAD/DEAH box helicase, partial [Cohnella sp. REN36]|uniref:DEAD/DEAH box helicase n=1 Tax=Cohnella sp. REN36 TaxID=2887347 RepID=UPI001D148DB4